MDPAPSDRQCVCGGTFTPSQIPPVAGQSVPALHAVLLVVEATSGAIIAATCSGVVSRSFEPTLAATGLSVSLVG